MNQIIAWASDSFVSGLGSSFGSLQSEFDKKWGTSIHGTEQKSIENEEDWFTASEVDDNETECERDDSDSSNNYIKKHEQKLIQPKQSNRQRQKCRPRFARQPSQVSMSSSTNKKRPTKEVQPNIKTSRDESLNSPNSNSEIDLKTRRTMRRLTRIRAKCESLWGSAIETDSSETGHDEVYHEIREKGPSKKKILRKKTYAYEYESDGDEWLSPNKCSKVIKKINFQTEYETETERSESPAKLSYGITSNGCTENDKTSTLSKSQFTNIIKKMESERTATSKKLAEHTKAVVCDARKPPNQQSTAPLLTERKKETYDKMPSSSMKNPYINVLSARQKPSKPSCRNSDLLAIPTHIVIPPAKQLSFQSSSSHSKRTIPGLSSLLERSTTKNEESFAKRRISPSKKQEINHVDVAIENDNTYFAPDRVLLSASSLSTRSNSPSSTCMTMANNILEKESLSSLQEGNLSFQVKTQNCSKIAQNKMKEKKVSADGTHVLHDILKARRIRTSDAERQKNCNQYMNKYVVATKSSKSRW